MIEDILLLGVEANPTQQSPFDSGAEDWSVLPRNGLVGDVRNITMARQLRERQDRAFRTWDFE
jgi:hypothetical protein